MAIVEKMTRLEVWTGIEAAGGTRVAVVDRLLTCVGSARLGGDWSLSATLDTSAVVAPELRNHRILRVVSATGFDEWRIDNLRSDPTAGVIEVTASPVLTLLGADPVEQMDGDGVRRYNFDLVGLTLSGIIDTYILPRLPAWVSRGVLDADPILPSVTVDWSSPLALLRQLEANVKLELYLRRVGTTGYAIDFLTTIGSTAPVADVRYGKNLLTSVMEEAADGQATRIYPRGANVDGYHATMAGARWRVATVIDADEITLEDPLGGDGPIAFDGQLVGRYVLLPSGIKSFIQVTVASTQRLDIGTHGLSVGDLVSVVADATGSDLTYLDNPAEQAKYGVVPGVLDRPDILGDTNVIPNSVGRDWTLTSGWTTITAHQVHKEFAAPYNTNGLWAIKVVTLGADRGIQSPFGPISPTARHPYVSGFASVYAALGTNVRVELVFQTPGGEKIVPLPPTVALTTVRDQWDLLGVAGIDALAMGATAVAVRVLTHGAGGTFYLNGVQATETGGQVPFIEGSGATKLWQAANERLRLYGGASTSYQLSLADLGRLDPAVWGDGPQLGGQVRVTDDRLPLVRDLVMANPGMNVDADASGVADGWTPAFNTGLTGVHSIEDNAQKITVLTSAASTNAYAWQNVYGLRGGDVLELSIEGRVSNPTGTRGGIVAVMYRANGTSSTTWSSYPLTNTAGYVKATLRGVVPADVVYMRWYGTLNVTSGQLGSVWLRNARSTLLKSRAIGTRIVGLDRDYLNDLATALTLSTRPEDLTGALARPPKASRLPVGATTDPTAPYIAPDLRRRYSENGTTGTLVLEPVDPQGRITLVEAAVAYGNQPLGGYVAVNLVGGVYTVNVPLVEKQPSRIAWRAYASDAATPANVTIFKEDVERFAIGAKPLIPDITYTIDELGRITVVVAGDSDTTSIKVLARIGSEPTGEEVITSGTVATGRYAQFPNYLTVGVGQEFYISAVAFNANAGGAPSDRQAVRDLWTGPNTNAATVLVDHYDVSATQLTLHGIAFGAVTKRVEVYYMEHRGDPGVVTDVSETGLRVPGTPLRVTGRSLTIPYSNPSNFLVVTLVAIDSLERVGADLGAALDLARGIITLKVQALASATTPPNSPTALAVASVTGSTVTLNATLPLTLLPARLQLYRNGTLVKEVAATQTAGFVQSLTDDGPLQADTGYTYHVMGVATDGTSATTPSPSVLGTTAGGTLPAPTISAGTYDSVAQAVAVEVTPGVGTPDPVFYETWHSSDGLAWNPAETKHGVNFSHAHAQAAQAQTDYLRTKAKKAGYTDSPWSAAVQVFIYAIGEEPY